jgi:putative addiction module killer protein
MYFIPKKLFYYTLPSGRIPFYDWFYSLDAVDADTINDRLEKVETGYLGDYKNLGEGVFELRIHLNPGYRIYFGIDGLEMVLLLCGGNKSTQEKDIKKAKTFWGDYKNAKRK